jgi:hypothetical protein
LNLQKSLEKKECSTIFPFLPIDWPISRIFTKLFEKLASGCKSKKMYQPIERGRNSLLSSKGLSSFETFWR